MRVWLVDDRGGDNTGGLEALLSQLANSPDNGLVLLGARPYGPDFAVEMRAQQPDVVVTHEPAWPEDPTVLEALGVDTGVVIATASDRCPRFSLLAERHCVWFIPASPTLDSLRLALIGMFAGLRRQRELTTQLARLQQRLNDRIVIERAKGVMVQHLGITEEEAYKRLRLQSRRQRRQIRDIAQSLLDTQDLLLPEANGCAADSSPEPRRAAQETPPLSP